MKVFQREAESAAIMYLHNACDAYTTRNDPVMAPVNRQLEIFWMLQMHRFSRVARHKIGPEVCPVCGHGLEHKHIPEKCPNCGIGLV